VSVRKIRLLGDPILRTPASRVTSFDGELRRLVKDLSDTLVEAGGAGLAAPQIGVLLRVFVYVDTDPVSPTYQQVRHLVNPVAADTSVETATEEEGCLSIPGIFCELARPVRVVANGFSEHEERVSVVGADRIARCFAHEIDHLDGVVFLDRLAPDERRRAMREIREMLLNGENVVVKRSPHGGVVG